MAEEQDSIDTGARSPQSHKSGAGKLIVVVAVLTLLAILLVPSQKEPESPDSTEPAKPEPAGGAPSLLSPGTATPETQTGPPGEEARPAPEMASGPGAAARGLIRELRSSTPVDLERAYRAAQTFDREGRSDDAYLMYFFAAREGHGPSAMVLAREADPASFKENGLFEAPDELQANKWYDRAVQAGVPGAAEALARLRSAVEKKAQAGDQRARRIMLQWK